MARYIIFGCFFVPVFILHRFVLLLLELIFQRRRRRRLQPPPDAKAAAHRTSEAARAVESLQLLLSDHSPLCAVDKLAAAESLIRMARWRHFDTCQ